MGSALVARVVERGCGIRKPVVIALVLAELVFAAAFITIRMQPDLYVKAFDIDNEQNLTTVFSAVQLVWIAGVIASFLLVPGMITKPLRPLAATAAAGFIFLGLDEYLEVHERLSDLLIRLEWVPRLKEDVGAWIPVYAATGVVLLLLFRRAISLAARLHPRPSMLFLAGLTVLILGSVGCEFIAFEFLAPKRTDPLYPFVVVTEEFLEMSGASVMLFAVLRFGADKLQIAERRNDRNSAMAPIHA